MAIQFAPTAATGGQIIGGQLPADNDFLAQILLKQAGQPVYSNAQGIGQMLLAGLGGFVKGREQAQNAKLIADIMNGGTGAASSSTGSAGSASSSAGGSSGGGSTGAQQTASTGFSIAPGPASDLAGKFAANDAKYGLPDGYTASTAHIEDPSGDPNAVSPTGATGPFQFTASTAKQYGLADRTDLDASMDAAGRLARDNAAALRKALGRDPTGAELYLAHQQGAQGALNILQNPNAPATGDAIMGNGGKPGMTNADFAAMWAKRYGAGAGPSLPPVASGDMASAGAPVNGPVAGAGDFNVSPQVLAAALNRAPPNQSASLAGPMPPSTPGAAGSDATAPVSLGSYQSPSGMMPGGAGQPAATTPTTAAPAAGPALPPVTPMPQSAALPPSPVTIPSFASPQGALQVPVGAPPSAAKPALSPQNAALAAQLMSNGGTALGPMSQVASAQAPQVAQAAAQAPGNAPGPAGAGAPPAGTSQGNVTARNALLARLLTSSIDPSVKAALLNRLSPTYGFQTLPDGTIVRTDPRNGTVTPIYRAPAKPVTVGEGANLVDPTTGRVIAQGGAKQPDAVQQYNFAVQQGYQGSFTDWQTKMKRAGAITIDQRAPSAFETAYGQGMAKEALATVDAGNQGLSDLQQVKLLQGLASRIQTGQFAPTGAKIGAVLQGMGLDPKAFGIDPNLPATAQAFSAIANKMVLGSIGGSGGMPANNFSDADRKFLTQTLPNLSNRPEANTALLTVAQRLAQLKIQKAQAWLGARAQGQSYEQFERDWTGQLSKQDVFGDVAAGLGKPTSGSANSGFREGQTATNPQTGARMIYRGGQWVPLQ